MNFMSHSLYFHLCDVQKIFKSDEAIFAGFERFKILLTLCMFQNAYHKFDVLKFMKHAVYSHICTLERKLEDHLIV
jgi:hypothetical protein